jgi:ABC-type antimicrobial peptide transport system ATPase subunit
MGAEKRFLYLEQRRIRWGLSGSTAREISTLMKLVAGVIQPTLGKIRDKRGIAP